MKIYKQLIIDIAAGQTISEQSFEYNGIVVQAAGLFSGPPKPPKPPKTVDPEIQKSADEQRRRALMAHGRSSTILTEQGSGRLGEVG